MTMHQQLYIWLFVFLSAAAFFRLSHGAQRLVPAMINHSSRRTAYSRQPGDGLWDNGAACGTHYRVRCISSSGTHACVPGGKVVTVKIVDNARTSVSRPTAPSTIALSETAFTAIAKSSAKSLNIEFERV
ncbi:hypothetical protein Patl1_12786 [Pistacia atlantica]|uniref:Uncharacterized protein n=1 Tax=Pistacia atlantica TaxID=434234 RepID=A0ACC1AU53_9ROSI|nr:hypothetical protein Patl1_12786 [Pistacia atlantica]